MNIHNIGVIGCGQMGGGIAQVCAQAGFHTVVREVNQPLLDKGLSRIRSILDKDVAKNKLSAEDRDAAFARLHPTTELADLQGCDLVIEAIVEELGPKRELFATLDQICPAHTLLVSNTSSIPIIEIATATKRPEQCAGLHFFNPVPVMKLVEVIRSIASSDQTIESLKQFGEALGKTVVEAKDSCGFIVNRLLIPYLFDAIRFYEAGMASREDIDNGMKLGCSHPMGPLTLLDFVGLDVAYNVGIVMFEEFKEPRFAPPPMLKRMVQAGYLGRKSGRGFYQYS